MFTAAVVLLLVEEGRLNLDDTLDTWYPDLVPGAGAITIRNLLQHTTGLYHFAGELLSAESRELMFSVVRALSGENGRAEVFASRRSCGTGAVWGECFGHTFRATFVALVRRT